MTFATNVLPSRFGAGATAKPKCSCRKHAVNPDCPKHGREGRK